MGVSSPTMLRATLRTPSFKSGQYRAFSRRVREANRGRGQPLRAVCPRNVVRLFRPLGRNWMPRINSGRPTVRLPQAEARDAKRGGPPLESPCRLLSLVLSFASKESTAPLGAAAPPPAPESARHSPSWGFLTAGLSYAAAFAPCPLRAIPAQGSPIGTEMMRLRMH